MEHKVTRFVALWGVLITWTLQNGCWVSVY